MGINLWRFILTVFLRSLFIFLFAIFFDVRANVPQVLTTINYGDVKYKSISKAEILKIAPNHRVLGLTVANFRMKYDAEFEGLNDKNVSLKKISLVIGYKNLDVLIDNKYKKNSCEYKAIKEHEKGHVKIYQEELKHYGNMLLTEIKNKIFDNSDLLYNKSKMQIEMNLNAIFNNQSVLVLKDKLQQVLISKNQAYDSQEEYIRVNKLCNNW